jgi:vacuolar protein sorting-associated protein 8
LGGNVESDCQLQQVIIITSTTMQVYDVHASKVVERVHFDTSTLVSPSLGLTVNGTVPYSDSVEVAHSVRVYKGKIFLLVRGIAYLTDISHSNTSGST